MHAQDGAGRLGRLLFARWGRQLDCELKQFRLVGDLLMESGAALELSTIFMPKVGCNHVGVTYTKVTCFACPTQRLKASDMKLSTIYISKVTGCVPSAFYSVLVLMNWYSSMHLAPAHTQVLHFKLPQVETQAECQLEIAVFKMLLSNFFQASDYALVFVCCLRRHSSHWHVQPTLPRIWRQ
jgi:hypothetical protein